MAAPAAAAPKIYASFVDFCEGEKLSPEQVKKRASSQIEQLREVAKELKGANPDAAAAKLAEITVIEAYVKKLDSAALPAGAKKTDGAAAAAASFVKQSQ